MANTANTPENFAYAVRIKKDLNGRKHVQIRVPSARDLAWMELPSEGRMPYLYDPEVYAVLIDPAQLPEWKVVLLEDLYAQFRAAENARKRKDRAYDTWMDTRACPVVEPSITVDFEAHVDGEDASDRILALIPNAMTRRYFEMHFLDGYTFVQIARQENPDADDEAIKRVANSIGRAVKRAVKKLREELLAGVSGSGRS